VAKCRVIIKAGGTHSYHWILRVKKLQILVDDAGVALIFCQFQTENQALPLY
jgi:hypothetical protein